MSLSEWKFVGFIIFEFPPHIKVEDFSLPSNFSVDIVGRSLQNELETSSSASILDSLLLPTSFIASTSNTIQGSQCHSSEKNILGEGQQQEENQQQLTTTTTTSTHTKKVRRKFQLRIIYTINNFKPTYINNKQIRRNTRTGGVDLSVPNEEEQFSLAIFTAHAFKFDVDQSPMVKQEFESVQVCCANTTTFSKFYKFHIRDYVTSLLNGLVFENFKT